MNKPNLNNPYVLNLLPGITLNTHVLCDFFRVLPTLKMLVFLTLFLSSKSWSSFRVHLRYLLPNGTGCSFLWVRPSLSHRLKTTFYKCYCLMFINNVVYRYFFYWAVSFLQVGSTSWPGLLSHSFWHSFIYLTTIYCCLSFTTIKWTGGIKLQRKSNN